MKAVTIPFPGPPSILRIDEHPDPSPAAEEVVIEVHATALNRADLLQRRGGYPSPADAPPYPGLECAGVIREVGSRVPTWRPGDRVMALLGGGGYAERVAVPAGQVMRIPRGLDFREAAALPEAWLTAFSNMLEIGRLQPGERVLIHAGASGVGSAAIQLAKWHGATVYTTASAAKHERVRSLGADLIINYHRESFPERVLDATAGEGVDLIIDFIGAPYWEPNVRALAPWGRLVLVGLMGGRKLEVDLSVFISKKLSVHGSSLRDRTLAQKSALIARFSATVLPAFAERTLHPVLDDARFTLDEIVAAHEYMEANRNIGKIIVDVRSHDDA